MSPPNLDSHPVLLHTSQVRRALVDPKDIVGVIGFQNDINAMLARIEHSPRAWEPLAKPFSYARQQMADFDRDDQDDVPTAVTRLPAAPFLRPHGSRDQSSVPTQALR